MYAADDPPPLAASHLRIARPSRDLARTERFWVSGLGLQVLERIQTQAEGDHELVMLGWPGAAWHMELVADPEGQARPTGSGGITIADHDGYRLVLSHRSWP
jgi:catechol 2,3-dioxygenase-like lactoylglutathione lyase family enzyme